LLALQVFGHVDIDFRHDEPIRTLSERSTVYISTSHKAIGNDVEFSKVVTAHSRILSKTI